MDCSQPGSSAHGISQARILEWVAISFCRGSSRPSDHTRTSCVSCIGQQILFTTVSPGEPQFSVQFSSFAQSCLTLCDPMNWSMPGLPVHHQLPEFTQLMSIESVMPSNHLILCHPLLLLPSIFPSIRVFSNESTLCIRWPKYWSFSFNISPSNEHPGLISFRIDWLDRLSVQGTLKSLLQHHSSKVSILRPSAFFIVQLSHPCMTMEKP